MAKTSKPKKITRRDAVAILGAGTVFGAVRPEPVHAREMVQPRPDRCGGVAEVSEYVGPGGHRIILADTCCGESQTAILVGTQQPGRKPSPNGQRHLKPLTDRLTTANLEEYCYMVWGLTDAELKSVREMMPARLNLQKPQK